MQSNNAPKFDCQRPSITDVISQYVALRKSGRELWGLCPFHAEKTASFAVNEGKGVFHCHGCHEGGDVIDFIQKIEGIGFLEACAKLGMDTSGRKQPPRITPSRRRAAERAVAWVLQQRAKLNTMIAVALEQRDLADSVGDSELGESFDREWFLLSEFYDSLEYAHGVTEMLAMRPAIEAITAEVAL
jgi:hypothetical protein